MKWIFPFLLLSSPCFAQTACDTIIRNNGKITAASIIRYQDGGIVYKKCDTKDGGQYFLSGKEIKDIKSQDYHLIAGPESPPSPPPAFVDTGHRSRLRKPGTPGHTVTAWIGGMLWNLPGEYFIEETTLNPKLGLEIGFKNNPAIRVAAVIVPVSNRSLHGNRKKTEPGGEVGLVVKNFTVGKLSGYISKVYWGGDIRFGQLSYAFSYKTPGLVEVNETYTWQRYMACLGYEFNNKRFAFDVCLPVGLSRYKSTIPPVHPVPDPVPGAA